MPTVHYYGRKTALVGKTLFEILANLRNFGVNRMIIKQKELLENPGQKCYYIVKKVEPVLDDKLDQGAIWAERIFKGAKVPELVFVDEESWHTDWQLVPKAEEDKYLVKPEELVQHGHPSTLTLLPKWTPIPPLMEAFLKRHYKARGGIQSYPTKLVNNRINILMHYKFNQFEKPHKQFKVVEEGQEPDLKLNVPTQKLLEKQYRPEAQAEQ